MNSNCLAGIRCPKCKAEGPFNIVVEVSAKMFDSGIEDMSGDTDWGDESPINCPGCHHAAKVRDFRMEHWPIDIDHPILCGESLYFLDPVHIQGEIGSSGWYEVVDAPLVLEDPESDMPFDEDYGDSVICLVNDAGSELEAFARELFRQAPQTSVMPNESHDAQRLALASR